MKNHKKNYDKQYQLITHLLELISKHGSWKAQQYCISNFLLENTAMLEDIQNRGISDLETTANLLLLEDTIQTFNNKKVLLKRVLSNEIMVILPLQNRICELIMPFLPLEKMHTIEQFRSLDFIKTETKICALAVEGYIERKNIYIVREILTILPPFINKNLREIFVFDAYSSLDMSRLIDISQLESVKVIPL
jgi:hypothetical protein